MHVLDASNTAVASTAVSLSVSDKLNVTCPPIAAPLLRAADQPLMTLSCHSKNAVPQSDNSSFPKPQANQPASSAASVAESNRKPKLGSLTSPSTPTISVGFVVNDTTSQCKYNSVLFFLLFLPLLAPYPIFVNFFC